MPRTSRGFTLLELMITVAITGIIVGLAARAIVLTNRGRVLRQATAEAQSGGRLGLGFLQDDLREASLGAGTGVVWADKGGNVISRPMVQVFDSVGPDGFLNAKPGTDALLIVRALPDGATVLVGDLAATNGPFVVTDASGFSPNDLALVGEYDDAVFMPIRSANPSTNTLTSGLSQPVLPGQHATKVPSGSMVRRARARLYYVDVNDQLMQAELLVPYPPQSAAEMVGTRAIAQGVENFQVTCAVEAPGTCPTPRSPGDPLTDEANAAIGPLDLGGARLDAGVVPTLRSVTIRASIRSKALHDESEPGDDPIPIDGVSVTTPDGVHFARRAFEIGVAVRNTSLGAL